MQVQAGRDEAARAVAEARAEADRLRAEARQRLADARAEVDSLSRQRDEIREELGQLKGVIEALAVPPPQSLPSPTTSEKD